MSLVNVRRDNKDPFYRYKMERILTKIEGKGNGIKTVVVNLSSVAQSLARPGSYLIKYFGFELGAQTNIDPPDDRWIINGAHEASKLQELLDGFITKFVLCRECKNPETVVNIKDGRILLDCKACGQRSSVEPQLKLTGFILKNASPNGEDKYGDIVSDDDDLTRKIKTEAQDLNIKVTAVKDDDWAVDMSAEAVRARQQQLPGDFKAKLVLNGDDEEEEGEGVGSTVYDEFGNWIQEQAKEKGGVDSVDGVEIYLKAKELGIDAKHRTVVVLVQTIFDENIISQIAKRAPILRRIGDSERHQKAVLGGTERLIGQLSADNADIYAQVPKILELYYESDIVSEPIIMKWGTKASRKYADLATSKKVRKAAEPFLKWLAEAESEDDDDEEEEE
ncbi:eukaryotic translation initiation factor 5 [Lasiosphaeria miniovina]|uniref:Eukaryotic translation initiation factor 5 n=1 Tax=Lasiosphaeria miniovina TaxID=1954250 RepID=A0AA40AVR9_9PEZI|nr:eukaryotic translation initiation factor 5 [Lasiosphaeria miniovina]KAK0722861.1 eukaryotic translation initiation factor 5 [Lasiosphaeria miniovina]